MDKRYFAGIIILLVLFSCKNKSTDYNYKFHSTGVFLNPAEYSAAENPSDLPGNVIINYPGKSLIPVSGTVSHHLLISNVIDKWYANLKKQKNIKTFIIISPNHYQLGNEIVSLSTLDWNCNGQIVKTNKKLVKKILKEMNLKEDRYAFHYEHGIGVELLYIKKYFPEADIVPIVMDEFHKQITKCYQLSDVLAEILKNNKNVFLLISTDFSHRADINLTNERDKVASQVLNSLDANRINSMYSDNNVGLITLFLTLKKMDAKNNFIFCHTNSNFFNNESKNDITSYFFTYQY